ncbi:MAG: hypothetical protein KGL39_27730 [Patescibacteria group bacterium]|nr:hypothetical protein [Patescibacteria group bacterium]
MRAPLVSDPRRTPTERPRDTARGTGQGLRGKSIVIWTEFGFGDELMLCRFATVFKRELGAERVTVVCQSAIAPVLRILADSDHVLEQERAGELPWHDFWVFPHSIPVHYSLEEHGVPASVPYLFADPQRVEHW